MGAQGRAEETKETCVFKAHTTEACDDTLIWWVAEQRSVMHDHVQLSFARNPRMQSPLEMNSCKASLCNRDFGTVGHQNWRVT